MSPLRLPPPVAHEIQVQKEREDGDSDDDAEDVVFARIAVVGDGNVLGEHTCEARSATSGEGRRQMNAPMTA